MTPKTDLRSFSRGPHPRENRAALTQTLMTYLMCYRWKTTTNFGSSSRVLRSKLVHQQRRIPHNKSSMKQSLRKAFKSEKLITQCKKVASHNSCPLASSSTPLWTRMKHRCPERRMLVSKLCLPAPIKKWKWSSPSWVDSWRTLSASIPAAIASLWRVLAWSCITGGTSTWGPSLVTYARRPSPSRAPYLAIIVPCTESTQLFRSRTKTYAPQKWLKVKTEAVVFDKLCRLLLPTEHSNGALREPMTLFAMRATTCAHLARHNLIYN